MREALLAGSAHHVGTVFQEPQNDLVSIGLKALEKDRAGYNPLNADALEQRVNEITERLQNHDANVSSDLTPEQDRLVTLIEYARERATARQAQLQNELNSNFGTQRLAPTKMGNVANTIQSYALRRYHCNFEIVWSNMQRLVQKDEKSNAALMESKTQLDFLVACCWLTLFWSAAWSAGFGWFVPSRTGFLFAAVAGPVIAYMWYRAAAEQYRSFADVAMTTLDAFRLDLLRDMHLRTPADVEEERYVWENIDRLTTYGEDCNFRYEQPPAKTP